MNRITNMLRPKLGMLNSRLGGKLAVAGLATVAVIYTVPRADSKTDPVSVALAQVVGQYVEPSPAAVAWDLPNLDNPRVDFWVKRFTTNPGFKSTLSIWLDRKLKYDDMISAKLAARNMPQDLVYLAMIESGFNPTAKSPAAAGGLWQFISETGQRYGLTVNKRVDERNHPDKATDAALSYLSDLHGRFGSWYLAAAAYNTGENRVGRIMREVTGSERGTDADYYTIAHRLPAETRDYVPKMIAAARVSKELARIDLAGSEVSLTE